jgi:hypothetical protein
LPTVYPISIASAKFDRSFSAVCYPRSILFKGQPELFRKDEFQIHISIYSILQTLGMDPNDGRNYLRFRLDFERAFAMYLRTDRFRHHETGERSHVIYFRIFWTMMVAKNRKRESVFRLDNEQHLQSSRQNSQPSKPIARSFLSFESKPFRLKLSRCCSTGDDPRAPCR